MTPMIYSDTYPIDEEVSGTPPPSAPLSDCCHKPITMVKASDRPSRWHEEHPRCTECKKDCKFLPTGGPVDCAVETSQCKICEEDCACCEPENVPHKGGEHFPGGCSHTVETSDEMELLFAAMTDATRFNSDPTGNLWPRILAHIRSQSEIIKSLRETIFTISPSSPGGYL